MIWFLEGQSSQRDIIQGARDALPPEVKIFASHRDDRPEITAGADISFTEPRGAEERISWVISTARTYGIKVILAGRLGGVFEQARARFEEAGLVLMTRAGLLLRQSVLAWLACRRSLLRMLRICLLLTKLFRRRVRSA